MKKIITILVAVIIVGVGAYLLIQSPSNDINLPDNNTSTSTDQDNSTTTDTTVPKGDTSDTDQSDDGQSVIGTSAGGNEIIAYNFGEGNTNLLFVGGIHGGYSWNTSLVAYSLIDYLEQNPEVVPGNIEVSVIPVLNPDGLEEVVGTTGRFTKADVPSSQDATIPGRFNANNVDLNRNFDCDWQSDAKWQNKDVDGGTQAFSEPESKALKSHVQSFNPDGVVVYYAAAGGVFTSNCHDGVLEETKRMTNTYADASGYPAYETFDFYEITGDATNWLAQENIPAISVLLSNHQDVEWSMNKKGVEALFDYFGE